MSGWREESGVLTRELRFADFAEAFAAVTRVAEIAERLDHHPDIEISYNRVVRRRDGPRLREWSEPAR
ncbi:MAG: 4a-hydroxytetrahydrobiopterin dehydratase [Ilumatobacter sp.]